MSSVEEFLRDLRYALRVLVKSPAVTVIAVVTIGIAIGANATVFGFVSALLLRPAPGVVDPQSVVSIFTSDYSSGPYGDSSYPDYLSLKSDATAFAAMAAMQDGSGVVRLPDQVERVPIASVTSEFFDLLGVRPAVGRVFTTADTTADAPPAALIGYRLWERAFARSAAVLGTAIAVNGRSYVIVGVVQKEFQGLDLGGAVGVWTPLIAPPAAPDERGNRGLAIIGRLRRGVTLQEAQVQVAGIANALGQAFPATNLGTLQAPTLARPMIALRHTRMPPDFRGTTATAGALLMAAVAVVLVVACANVAGLLVSRTLSRDREIAIRLALGAARFRVIRQLLTESLLLGLAGGACGLLLALWTSDVLPSFFPAEQAALLETSVDVQTIVFVASLSIASSLLFGLAPALHASKALSTDALRSKSNRASDNRSDARLRRVLVTGQISAAVVLLVCSALLVKSFLNSLDADPGFGTREGVVATAELPNDISPEKGVVYFDEMLNRVRQIPGVQSASLVSTLPLNRGSRRGFRIKGYEVKANEDMELVVNVVADKYFETMQIPLKKGRTFNTGDRQEGQPVVVVNDLVASRFFGGDAVGRHMTDSHGRAVEIVGVVQAHKYLSVDLPPVPMVYFPLDQEQPRRMSLVARVTSSPRAMIEPIRRVMAETDKRVPIFRTLPLSTHLEEAIAGERLIASLVTVCGGMALLLATTGLYGVIAYAVVRRTREIGIRIALGAQPVDILRVILHEGLGVTTIGLTLGLIAAALAARTLDAVMPLYGVKAWDPATYVLVPLMLLAVSILAAGQPARRALRLDPNSALRQE
jgi:putative ABC transport system permease protein